MTLRILLAGFFLLGTGSGRGQITAAVGSSVRYAMEDLISAFAKQSGIKVKAVYGASGKFAVQMKNGAPFDVFVSADMDFPDSLYRWGLAEKPSIYAYGKLVLWTLKDLDLSRGLAGLDHPAVARVALADPKLAPYGREAARALRKAGVYERVGAKLVYGESVAQVSHYVLSGNADVGLTAKSMVVAGELAGKGKWMEVDSALYNHIAQGAVVCAYGKRHHPRPSAAFLAFLGSAEARGILAGHGYLLP